MIFSHRKFVRSKSDESVLHWNPISALKRKSRRLIKAAEVNTGD